MNFLGCRRGLVMFAVVENEFEHPVGAQGEIFPTLPRAAVAVFYRFRVALRELAGDESISLLRRWRFDAIAVRRYVSVDGGRVFWLVLVEDGIPFVVIAFANAPGEDACGISRVGDPCVVAIAIKGRDIVL
jgi:hypothetical protein